MIPHICIILETMSIISYRVIPDLNLHNSTTLNSFSDTPRFVELRSVREFNSEIPFDILLKMILIIKGIPRCLISVCQKNFYSHQGRIDVCLP